MSFASLVIQMGSSDVKKLKKYVKENAKVKQILLHLGPVAEHTC